VAGKGKGYACSAALKSKVVSGRGKNGTAIIGSSVTGHPNLSSLQTSYRDEKLNWNPSRGKIHQVSDP
jgi:hypothetical protein